MKRLGLVPRYDPAQSLAWKQSLECGAQTHQGRHPESSNSRCRWKPRHWCWHHIRERWGHSVTQEDIRQWEKEIPERYQREYRQMLYGEE